MRSLRFLVPAMLVSVAGACAQVPAVVTRVASPRPAAPLEAQPVRSASGPIVASAPGSAGTSAVQKPSVSPRLQRLQQVQFDRRPSAILRAWSSNEAAPAVAPGPRSAQPTGTDQIDAELAVLRRNVTLGNWPAVKAYLAGLPDSEGTIGYKHLLQSLLAFPTMRGPFPPGVPMMPQFMERNTFNAEDVVGLAAATPRGLDTDALTRLGSILNQAISGGVAVKHVVARFRAEVAKPLRQAALSPRQAARLLANAGQAIEAADFLPTLERAQADGDSEALNLLARHYAARHAKDQKAADLERAWAATQDALAVKLPVVGFVSQAALASPWAPARAAWLAWADAPLAAAQREKDEAMQRAVELAPSVREQLGQAWLEQSFTTQPQRGMTILAAIGGSASQGMTAQPHNPDARLKGLQLQKTAIAALLKAAPKRAVAWRESLTLLAHGWLKEAEFTQTYDRSVGFGSHMRRDPYGNIFWVNDGSPGPMMMPQQQNMPRAIATGDLLKARPEAAWLARIDDGLRPRLLETIAKLYLKAAEEESAFPYIEKLAGAHPAKAKELVNEFLRVWTRNHDPNVARSYTNPYMYMYGFDMRAQSIPLTRSKQERNLVDLAGWVKRLRKLPIGEPDEELLAKAFTSCHSSAEVYRLEAIETVFGPLGGLKPKTLAGLAQQMRQNLASVWRKPAVQSAKKTNRKPKDIQTEVLRGYSVARGVVADGIRKFPNDWSLNLAAAALLHDEIAFRQELAKTSDFSAKRAAALAGFRHAAQLYAAKVKDLPEEQQSTLAYEQWFYASLGAVELAQLSEENQPDLRQPALIRAAILALPGELAKKHMSRFANLLFTRLSSVAPAAKHRYLKGGFEIVGDHKQAHEARKVFDYYKDLVREIKLEVVPDGSAAVGHGEPFGVFVNLRHTREIERESGGFGRYLQNQNSGQYYSYNYGRPTADYRDRFQAAATAALKEQFEVLSVTFQPDTVHSRAAAEYGWRITPYAYILLKARGPQVDKIPPLRIDLDFLDTSGYVILPIESPAVPVDAHATKPGPRPLRKVQITQTLDERQADKGKLVLEVKVTGLGLVGELNQLLALDPGEFEIVGTEDRSVSVAKFDPDSDPVAVASERTWVVTLQAKPGLERPPQSFRFASAKGDGAEMIYQRYQDADLVPATQELSLEQQYSRPSYRWIWWAAGAALALIIVAVAVVWAWRSRRLPAARAELPDRLTPFSVLAILEQARQLGRLSEAERTELASSMGVLERHFFAGEANGDGGPDLRGLAERWAPFAR